MNKKHIFEIVLNVFIYFLIVIVGLYLVFAFYHKFIIKDNVILIGKYYIFQVATGSMENELIPGDYIIVKKNADYKVGDIVTYLENGYYITHRINDIKDGYIITKGDANTALDDPISKDKIVGKYLFKARILTFITRYKVLIISILLSLIILEKFLKSNNEVNKNDEILDK